MEQEKLKKMHKEAVINSIAHNIQMNNILDVHNTYMERCNYGMVMYVVYSISRAREPLPFLPFAAGFGLIWSCTAFFNFYLQQESKQYHEKAIKFERLATQLNVLNNNTDKESMIRSIIIGSQNKFELSQDSLVIPKNVMILAKAEYYKKLSNNYQYGKLEPYYQYFLFPYNLFADKKINEINEMNEIYKKMESKL